LWCPDPQLLLLCQGPDESFQLGPPDDAAPLSPKLLLYGEPYQGAPPVLRYLSADLDEREPTTAISAISAPPAKHTPTTMRTVIEPSPQLLLPQPPPPDDPPPQLLPHELPPESPSGDKPSDPPLSPSHPRRRRRAGYGCD
jgi:hypothetical protein